ncbi:MAG: hypothetical protein VKN72_04790 [Nostocales cyanobacterium 94392]|nr:hypothetical protein [Nostocales cyanobacterium 94392]
MIRKTIQLTTNVEEELNTLLAKWITSPELTFNEEADKKLNKILLDLTDFIAKYTN